MKRLRIKKKDIVNFETFMQRYKLKLEDSVMSFVLWKINTTPNGTGLIGASQKFIQGIVNELYEFLERNPDFGPLVKWQKSPHHLMVFNNGFTLYFRPSGYDGEAYRGIHVKTFAIKYRNKAIENKKIIVEFMRTTDPGCVAMEIVPTSSGGNVGQMLKMLYPNGILSQQYGDALTIPQSMDDSVEKATKIFGIKELPPYWFGFYWLGNKAKAKNPKSKICNPRKGVNDYEKDGSI